MAVDGRRPIYLYTSLLVVIGLAGVAAAQNIPSLLYWSFVQSMGASLGPVLGAAVIGDIFRLEERGGAMGVCFAASRLIFIIFGRHKLISIKLDWPVWNDSHSFPCRYFFLVVTLAAPTS